MPRPPSSWEGWDIHLQLLEEILKKRLPKILQKRLPKIPRTEDAAEEVSEDPTKDGTGDDAVTGVAAPPGNMAAAEADPETAENTTKAINYWAWDRVSPCTRCRVAVDESPLVISSFCSSKWTLSLGLRP